MLGLLALTASCLDDSASAPADPTTSAALVLRATAELAAAERDVAIRVFYLRGSTPVDLPSAPSQVRVTGGETRREAVTVQLAPCLADPLRQNSAAPGCRLHVELRLLDAAGQTLDIQTSQPEAAAIPGEALEVPPIALSEISTISISAVPVLRVQDTRTLTATPVAPNGQPIGGRTFVWASSNPAVVTVNPATGAIVAVAPGSAVISASTGVRRGEATVRVIQRVASVLVTAPSPTIVAGTTQRMTLTPRDAVGNTVGDLADRTIAWQSSAPTIASVDPTGLVTALRGGTAQISATVDGITGSTNITVTVPPLFVTPESNIVLVARTVQLQSVGAVGSITWTSSDTAVATVSATGLVTARFPGVAQITATTPAGQSALVTVEARPFQTTVTRATQESVSQGYSFTLTDFVALDADNQPIPNVVPVWSVRQGSASLSVVQTEPGVWTVTGLAPGQATLVAHEQRTEQELRVDDYTVLRSVSTGQSGMYIGDGDVQTSENQSFVITGGLWDDTGALQRNRVLLVSTSPAGQGVVVVPSRVRTSTSGTVESSIVIPVQTFTIPAAGPNPYVVTLTVTTEGDTRTESLRILVFRGTAPSARVQPATRTTTTTPRRARPTTETPR
ncbi:MAG TPA: Ig-like domain-containing protein [Gemmatimonadaceae bacterium]|nr:Ig-like domain-containing protein [Gemmatimonadaceae bacterium]